MMYAAFLEDPLTWALLGAGSGDGGLDDLARARPPTPPRHEPRVAAPRSCRSSRRSRCVDAAWRRCWSPTYPNYDTYFHLVWGRELLARPARHDAGFEAYAAPTEHPLWIAVVRGRRPRRGPTPTGCSCCSACSRSWRWCGARSGSALACFGPWPALAGAFFVGSSFVVPALRGARLRRRAVPRARRVGGGARGRSGRGAGPVVMALLAVAGLLRPEAWVLAGLLLAVVRGPRRAGPARARRSPRRCSGALVDLAGHRRPAALAARHQRARRRARPRARARRGAGLVRVVPGADALRPPVRARGARRASSLAWCGAGGRPRRCTSRSRCSPPA